MTWPDGARPEGHFFSVDSSTVTAPAAAAGVDADAAAPAPPKLELEKITCSNGLVWTADSKKVGVATIIYHAAA